MEEKSCRAGPELSRRSGRPGVKPGAAPHPCSEPALGSVGAQGLSLKVRPTGAAGCAPRSPCQRGPGSHLGWPGLALLPQSYSPFWNVLVDTSQGCWEAQERRTMGSSSGSRRKGVFAGAKHSSWPGRALVWCLGACWGWQPMLRGPAYTCLSEDRGQLTHGSLAFYLEGRAVPTGDIYTKAPPLLLSGTEGLESQLSFCLPSVLPCMLRPLPGHLQRSPAGRVEGEPQGECPGQCMACCKGTLL